jgi:hypothetical protein
MSDRPSKHAELLLLCGKVRDNVLTPEDAARLDELLQDNHQAKALYVRYMSVLSLMESRGASQATSGADSSDTIDEDVFSELLALEQQAEAEIVEQPMMLHLQVKDVEAPWQIAGAARWLAEKPATWASIAALVAIALVLVVVFTGTPGSSPIAVGPDESATANEQAVATLTAEHNAIWDRRPGQDLYAGQRFTLTQGFAEITTKRGAIAILEAPATIELLDNNNALRLHTGKLVGICETESSKGFVVRTQFADITDIGTVFGVAVGDADLVTTRVIKGEIDIHDPLGQADRRPNRLTAGQAAIIDASGLQRLELSDQDDPFKPLAALRDGITAMSGQVVLQQDQPSRINATVQLELAGHRLQNDIDVSADWPANHPKFIAAETSATIRAGTVIRSYILQFSPQKGQSEEPVTCRGSVTFSGRVLGLITTNDQHDRFVRDYGGPASRLMKDGGRFYWPEYGNLNSKDQINLLDNERTLEFVFIGHLEDAVRVILEEPVHRMTQN